LLGKTFQAEVDKMFVSLPNTKKVLEQSSSLTIPDFKTDQTAEGIYDKPTIENAKNLILGLDISDLGPEI